MIHSMTGYGRAEVLENGRKVIVEINSVNHRYLDLNIKLARPLLYLDDPLRKMIKAKVARGKVEVNVSYQSTDPADINITINEALGKHCIAGLRQFGSQQGLKDDLKLSDLMTLNELIVINKQMEDENVYTHLVMQTAEKALEKFCLMRSYEGDNLLSDLLTKNRELRELVEKIEQRSPQVVLNYKTRLENRLKELLNVGSIDEQRIAMEVVLFADKCAIDEELTRLNSHSMQLEQILAEGGIVGRKLDFLMQELNREANTIGSKANDSIITKYVITLKTEIEKMREQVQNIE